MRRVGQVVVDQRGDAGAVVAVQGQLRRRGRGRPAVHVDAGIAGEAGRMHAVLGRQALHGPARQRHAIHLHVGRAVLACGEVDVAGGFVQRQHAVHRPVAGRQRGGAAPGVDDIEVLVAAALAAPQQAPVRQEAQVVVQRHPRIAGFGDQRALRAGGQVGLHQVEPLLVTRLPLEGEPLRVAPVHARQIDVGVFAQIDPPGPRARAGDKDAQLHADVGIAGRRVALLDDVGAVRVDLVALLHRHGGFVDAREGDRRVVRRPPVPGVAVHLLVGDELGHAVADGVAAVVRQLDGPAAGQLDHPQVAVADEADEAALGRELGVGGETAAVGQLAHGIAAGLAQVDQVELPAQREQHRLPVRRPLVIDDAAEACDALALATRLLLVRQPLLARQHVVGIDQARAGAGLDVVRPQVEAVAVGIAPAQEADPTPVRRHLRLDQAGAGQRRIAGDGLERQRAGGGGRGLRAGGAHKQARTGEKGGNPGTGHGSFIQPDRPGSVRGWRCALSGLPARPSSLTFVNRTPEPEQASPLRVTAL